MPAPIQSYLVTFYRENTSEGHVDTATIIVAGPVAVWLLANPNAVVTYVFDLGKV